MDLRVKERLVGATILVVLIVLIVPELLSGPKSRVASTPVPLAAERAEPLRNVTVDLATSKATPAENTAASAVPPGGDGVATGDSAPRAALADGAAPGAARAEVASGEPVTGASAAPREPPAIEGPSSNAPSGPARGPRSAVSPTIVTLKAQQPAHAAEAEVENAAPIPTSTAAKSAGGNEAAASRAPNHHWAVQLGSFASRANADKLVRQLKSRDSSVYVSSGGKGASLRYRVRIGPLADRDSAERMLSKLKKEGRPATLVPP